MLDYALGFLGVDIDDRMDTCIYNSHALAINIDVYTVTATHAL